MSSPGTTPVAPAPRPAPPQAVLFDCDGVLVDSEPFSRRVLQADLAARGLKLPLAEVEHRFMGSTMGEVRRAIEAEGLNLPADWVRVIYDRLYADLEREGVPLIPGIEAALEALAAAGIPCAVGSNGEARKMEITLGQHPQVRAHFRGRLFSGQELGCIKPDPGLYLHAARALEVPPAACVVIDDSRFGCMAGIAAGMRTLAYVPRGDGAALAALGAEVFHEMARLPGLLGIAPPPGTRP